MLGVIMLRPLTWDERLNVELKTKGENRSYRRFPPQAVAVWLAAEVVTTPAQPPRRSTLSAMTITTARTLLSSLQRLPGVSQHAPRMEM